MRNYSEPEIVKKIAKAEEIAWTNSKKVNWENAKEILGITVDEIDDAEQRLLRFAPFVMKCFPETIPQNVIIESELLEISKMR